ncbi:MAG TPA: nitroreductase family protein [Candidatus Mediterraneibacter cottocaccae]|nr:nitroreductase family protein [Candidatus Mediterraneibacter cottocaccae]
MIREIYERRSIRKFSEKPLPKQDIMEIIESGTKAPSSKNRQPWKYIVVQGEAKREMLEAFRTGIKREENGEALLPGSRQHISAAKYTVKIMEQAPVILFAVNPLGKDIFAEMTPEERIYEICNIQSLSASIQNMLLAAEEKGIGSLWICDIYFAYGELCRWLDTEGELLAAIAFGYPEESPGARPRRAVEDVVEWRKDRT